MCRDTSFDPTQRADRAGTPELPVPVVRRPTLPIRRRFRRRPAHLRRQVLRRHPALRCSLGGWLAGVLAWAAALLLLMLVLPGGAQAQSLDEVGVRAAVETRREAISACYTAALSSVSELSGRLELVLAVGVDGSVERASIARASLSSPSPELERCVLEAVRTVRFGAQGSPTEVHYPLDFAPARAGRVATANLTAHATALAAFRHRLRSDEEVQRCYDQALAQDEGVSGRLVVDFTVDADGRMVSVRAVESSLEMASLEACVLGAMSRISLPVVAGQTGEQRVRLPFMFGRR